MWLIEIQAAWFIRGRLLCGNSILHGFGKAEQALDGGRDRMDFGKEKAHALTWAMTELLTR